MKVIVISSKYQKEGFIKFLSYYFLYTLPFFFMGLQICVHLQGLAGLKLPITFLACLLLKLRVEKKLFPSVDNSFFHRYVNKPAGNLGLYDPTEIHNRHELKAFLKEAMIKLGFHLVFFFLYLYR